MQWIFSYRERTTNGAKQSLNTEQISHPACPSLTLHFWILAVLTKKSVWTLAQSVLNEWTKINLKPLPNYSLVISFYNESWLLPFLLFIYLLKLWAKEKEKNWLEHCAMKFNTAPNGLGSLSRFNTLFWEMSTFVKKKSKIKSHESLHHLWPLNIFHRGSLNPWLPKV